MPSGDDYQYDFKAIDQTEIFAIVVGTISAIFPLSVVVILLYRSKKLLIGRSLTHYVLMIAMSDTITATTIAMGYPRPGSDACYAQGITIIITTINNAIITMIIIIFIIIIIITIIIIINITIVKVSCLSSLVEHHGTLPMSSSSNYVVL